MAEEQHKADDAWKKLVDYLTRQQAQRRQAKQAGRQVPRVPPRDDPEVKKLLPLLVPKPRQPAPAAAIPSAPPIGAGPPRQTVPQTAPSQSSSPAPWTGTFARQSRTPVRSPALPFDRHARGPATIPVPPAPRAAVPFSGFGGHGPALAALPLNQVPKRALPIYGPTGRDQFPKAIPLPRAVPFAGSGKPLPAIQKGVPFSGFGGHGPALPAIPLTRGSGPALPAIPLHRPAKQTPAGFYPKAVPLPPAPSPGGLGGSASEGGGLFGALGGVLGKLMGAIEKLAGGDQGRGKPGQSAAAPVTPFAWPVSPFGGGL